MTTSWAIVAGLACAAGPADGADSYRIGRSVSDITLPVVGVQMLGFVRPDQISEGIHQRQYARTFVVADTSDKRVAIVTCDIAFPTHTLKLAVLERLRQKLGPRYEDANLVLAATHTHGAPGGFHHHIDGGALGGGFYGQCFDALVDGISASIIAADADLKPGRILLAQGEVEGAGVNRSRVAYMNNPDDERARYKEDVDTTMTLLRFERQDGPIGMLNWFAVHGTSMNFYNKLISGDNKGYAAYAVERAHGTRYTGKPEFVAAFAQTNAGDVTPNLNLNNTGPGKTDVESTQIIGSRQARAAEKLFAGAKEPISGPIDFRHEYVDFSKLDVADEFTGNGLRRTCASALGYSFAAGSTEDGGGHPLFKEGMKESNPLIDQMARANFPDAIPTKELRQCQQPKAILIATGMAKPPGQEQVLPVGVVRIGQLVLAVTSAEYTTMSGRRVRTALGKEFGVDPRYVVIAGYANDYSNYVTTREEYETQQYEGGSTVFGPWTEAGYRQEFVRLARAMKSGQSVESKATPADMRTRVKKILTLEGPDEQAPANSRFGAAVVDAKERYAPGDLVSVCFWTGSPVNDYKRTDHFLAVERHAGGPDSREIVRQDFDWDTTARWKQMLSDSEAKPASKESGKDSGAERNRLGPPPRVARPEPFQVTVTWQTDTQTEPGTYRIVHYARFKKDGKVERLVATSRPFEIRRE
jgi:neutral ceramidase